MEQSPAIVGPSGSGGRLLRKEPCLCSWSCALSILKEYGCPPLSLKECLSPSRLIVPGSKGEGECPNSESRGQSRL